MKIGLHYKDNRKVFEEKEIEQVPFLQYPLFENTNIVNHGISTRLGGVSKGIYATMNLSYTRGDAEENVRENYRRIGKAIGVDPARMVCSRQTHTTNVRIVTEEDAGKGVTRERDYDNVDGLVTNIPGICLVTFYADCVPLLFVDPVKRVIASSHSGWRGTAARMGQVTVDIMRSKFGCRPEDILAAVGPSICQDCYEVSEDVILQFQKAFREEQWKDLYYKRESGKYQLNLWKANEIILLEAGIPKENLSITDICTCCNPDFLYSHRASKGMRGNLAAFLGIR